MTLAPLTLFIYNRVDCLQRTLKALARNDLANQLTLVVYADGPKSGASKEEMDKINQARNVVKNQQWCKKIQIIERKENLGLAKSIIEGVSEVIEKYGRVVVLEDDLVTSPYFLRFMNEALETYDTDKNVISIGACNFFAQDAQVSETFFISVPDCLGWATWRDRWKLFEPDSNKLLSNLRSQNLINKFNLYGAYNFESMLEAQAQGRISSWAIRWQAVAHLERKLTLYPKYSLTQHIGIGADATHSAGIDHTDWLTLASKPITVSKQPVVENPLVNAIMQESYKRLFPNSQPTQFSQKVSKTRLQKRLLKKLVPPIVFDVYRAVKSKKKTPLASITKAETAPTPAEDSLLWSGNYPSWEAAMQDAKGYDAPNILEHVKTSVLKVKNGEAVYERDSVLFDKIEYSWPLLAALLKIATESNNELRIVDFGGSLGSTFFQNRHFLKALRTVQWGVVEQSHFVACGREYIAGDGLEFYEDVAQAISETGANTLLASGVIQCLDKPYNWIEEFIQLGFDNIVIDRTAFVHDGPDILTVQHVPESIYKASYPAWFFNYEGFLSRFEDEYELVADFDSVFTPHIVLEDGRIGQWRGLIFKKKTNEQV